MYQSNSEVLSILEDTGAVVNNSHFVYVSGKHARSYVNKDFVYPHTKYISRIGEIIAEKFKDSGVEVVAGPSMGGIIMSQWTAHHLSQLTGREVLSVYTEKQLDKGQAFTRGYDKYVVDKKVLVVEDIVTTGGSVKKVVETVSAAGGNVVAACSMVNKDPEHINPEFMGVPFEYLTVVDMDVWEEVDCPLCQEGVPINTQLGHGKQYLANKQQ